MEYHIVLNIIYFARKEILIIHLLFIIGIVANFLKRIGYLGVAFSEVNKRGNAPYSILSAALHFVLWSIDTCNQPQYIKEGFS
jgi:hypothetical protein